jgi:hypothetical protein
MAGRVLGIDTANDDLTQTCLDVREARVYPLLTDLGLEVDRLTGPDATAEAVVDALTAEVDFVTASGHGLPGRLIGRSGTVLEVGHYPPEAVQGKIIHLLACNCGELLGPDLVANGCRAFFGYNLEFFFPASSPRDFLDCDGTIDRAIAEGSTAEDVFREVIQVFNRRIAALRQEGDNFRASLVEHNRNCLVAPSVDPKWGDPAASL